MARALHNGSTRKLGRGSRVCENGALHRALPWSSSVTIRHRLPIFATRTGLPRNSGFLPQDRATGRDVAVGGIKNCEDLNADPTIHGILVQSPPPPHINEEKIVFAIDPSKDVDGFHPMNVGKLAIGDPTALVPCTPLGCQRLLLESGIEITGAHVVIIGRSMLVGKPLGLLLMRKGKGGDATVTIAHSRTRNLADISRTADILVAAIGKPEFVRGEYVKEGAVIIDVGINRVEDQAAPKGYRITGDVAFAETAARARAITPVPGGVGPMTVAMLMANTVTACENQTGSVV